MYSSPIDQAVATQPFMEQLSRGMSRAENALSYIARIPVIGTAAGVTKVAMGVLQTVAATAGVVIGLFTQIFDNKRIFAYSQEHLINGVGNILAGTLEAIPLVGTVLWYVVRKHHCHSQALMDAQLRGEIAKSREKRARPTEHQVGPEEEASRRVDEVFSGFNGLLDSQEIKFDHYYPHPEQVFYRSW